MNEHPIFAGMRLVEGAPDVLEDAFLEGRGGPAPRPVRALDVIVGACSCARICSGWSPSGGRVLNIRFTTLGELGVRLGERSCSPRRPAAAPGDGGARYAPRSHAGRTATSPPSRTRPALPMRRGGSCASYDRRRSPDDARPPIYPRSPSRGRRRVLVDLYARYLDGRDDRYDGDDALAVPSLDNSTERNGAVRRLAPQRARPSLVERIARTRPGNRFLPDLREHGRPGARRAAGMARQPRCPEHRADDRRSETDARPSAGDSLQHDEPWRSQTDGELVSAPDPLTEVAKQRASASTGRERASRSARWRCRTARQRSTGPLVEAVFRRGEDPGLRRRRPVDWRSVRSAGGFSRCST